MTVESYQRIGSARASARISIIRGFLGRRGMTLLELLVVLTILIAISGIVVATLPGLWRQSQSATTAVNLQQIDAGIRRNLILQRGLLGNRFDALVEGSGNLSGGIPEYIPGRSLLDVLGLSEADLGALAAVGVTELVPASKTSPNATLASHTQPPVALKSQSRVAVLTAAAAEQTARELWNVEFDRNTVYLVLGLGSQCTLIGAGQQAAFAEAPIYFPEDRNQDATKLYSRFLVIVELKRNETSATARYLGTVTLGPSGVKGITNQVNQFHSSGT